MESKPGRTGGPEAERHRAVDRTGGRHRSGRRGGRRRGRHRARARGCGRPPRGPRRQRDGRSADGRAPRTPSVTALRRLHTVARSNGRPVSPPSAQLAQSALGVERRRDRESPVRGRPTVVVPPALVKPRGAKTIRRDRHPAPRPPIVPTLHGEHGHSLLQRLDVAIDQLLQRLAVLVVDGADRATHGVLWMFRPVTGSRPKSRGAPLPGSSSPRSRVRTGSCSSGSSARGTRSSTRPTPGCLPGSPRARRSWGR